MKSNRFGVAGVMLTAALAVFAALVLGGGCKHNDGVPQESVKFTLTVKDSEGNQIYSEAFEEGTEIKADEILEKVKKEKNSVSLTDEKTGEAFDSVKISGDIVLVAKYVRFFTLTVKDSEGNRIYSEDLAEGTEIRADRLSEKESIKKEGSSVYFTDENTGKSFDSAAISEDTVLSAVYVEEGTTEEVTLTLDLFSSDDIESEDFKLYSAKVIKGTRLKATDIMSKCVGSYGNYNYVLYDENGVQRNSVVVFKDMTVRIDQKRVPKNTVTVEYSGGEFSSNTFSYKTGSKVTRSSVIWDIENWHSQYRVSSLKCKDGTEFNGIDSFTEDITLVATLVSSLSLPEVTVGAAQAAETIRTLTENKKVIVEGEITDEISTRISQAVKQSKNSLYLDLSKAKGLKSIPDLAFVQNHKLVGIAFPDSLETIGKSAFEQNFSLVEVKFGKGLKTIGELAFWQTLGIDYIGTFTIPASVEKIEAKAFDSYGETISGLSVAFENTSGWSAKKEDTVKTFTSEELSTSETVKEYLCYRWKYSEYEWTRTPSSAEESAE